MPWKEVEKTMLREDFVKQVLEGKLPKSKLCAQYGISRPTGDKWLKRYLNGEPLTDQSKAPFKTANKTPFEIEKLILDYRREHPAIGALKIKKALENKGYSGIPASSTINGILKRNNCISRKASLSAAPHRRFEKSQPNEMWQSDFKGHYLLGDGTRCHTLNVLDDHSRYNLCTEALTGEKFSDVDHVYERIFKEYGLPRIHLCDNGNPWGTSQSTGYTRFEVWFMDLGILTIHGRPLHPQTQGKEERYNRTLQDELLDHNKYENIYEAQKSYDIYREFYNNERPHHALGLDVPSEHYVPSIRKYKPKPEIWEYGKEYKVHKVKSSGYISIRGQGYFLSEAFGDKEVGVRESNEKDSYDICYREFLIGRINTEKRVFTLKRAYLLENDPRNDST